MPWEVIILPVIAVAVWIIGTLIRNAEKEQGPAGAPPRKAERVTDLDRFLREVHRRRQMGERAEERPEPSERRREPAPPPVRRPPPRQEELPVDEVVVVESPAPAPALRVHEAPPLPDVPSDKSARPPAQGPEPVALGSLRRLLRSREGMRTAMILREVLGPPLARRR
jgi:hypothetical protein